MGHTPAPPYILLIDWSRARCAGLSTEQAVNEWLSFISTPLGLRLGGLVAF